MDLTLSDIAKALNTPVLGDGTLLIRHLSEPASAGPDDLALAMSSAYAEGLSKGKARAAVLWSGADWQVLGLQGAVCVGRPRLAMSQLTAALDRGPDFGTGVHPTALIDPAADLHPDAVVGAYTVIGAGARIGPRARIGHHVSIGGGAQIGADALIAPGVHIGGRVTIGDRFIAHSGAVLGSDGFSFVTAEVSAVENARSSLGNTGDAAAQAWTRIHSLGGILIGDDVEMGANSAIDYGTVRATSVGDGTKLDNLVHVAHNVTVGRHCLLCGQVGIAGSTRIGDHVVLGGQVGVVDNIVIGDRVIAGAASKILSNVPAGRVIQGYPAVKMETHVEGYKAIRRLPRLFAQVAALQKSVANPDENT